jgi:Skp family chaperone for outer membrane proteins
VEQSIARFEKRLDEANSALQTLGNHLGRGAQSGYKDVTSTLRALRREAVKTNKQALKDFDQLRAALTKSSSTRSGSTRSASTRSTAAKRSTARSTAAKPAARSTSSSRSSSSRSAGTGTRSSRSRKKSS